MEEGRFISALSGIPDVNISSMEKGKIGTDKNKAKRLYKILNID